MSALKPNGGDGNPLSRRPAFVLLKHSLSVAQHSLTVLALRELDGPLMFGRSFRDQPIQQRGASTSKSATNAGTSNWL